MARVKIDLAKLSGIEQAITFSAIETMRQIQADLVNSQTIPFDTGTLQRTHFIEYWKEGNKTVRVLSTSRDVPYARRLYYHPEYNFQKVNNANAGGLWFRPYEEGGAKENMMQDIYMKIMKERLEALK